jgi:hypothetical protein
MTAYGAHMPRWAAHGIRKESIPIGESFGFRALRSCESCCAEPGNVVRQPCQREEFSSPSWEFSSSRK